MTWVVFVALELDPKLVSHRLIGRHLVATVTSEDTPTGIRLSYLNVVAVAVWGRLEIKEPEEAMLGVVNK